MGAQIQDLLSDFPLSDVGIEQSDLNYVLGVHSGCCVEGRLKGGQGRSRETSWEVINII